MSVSNALQAMIYARLIASADVAEIVGGRVYDGPPLEAAYPFVSFGASYFTGDDSDCITGRVETMQIDCWSSARDGKREVKALADAVKAALHRYDGVLADGALVSLDVVLVRVMDDPDPTLKHGVVQVQALIDEVIEE